MFDIGEGLGPMACTVGFGKYRNRTLEWLFFHDPGYVWWMIDKDAVKNLKGATRNRFDQLVRRAMHLVIPGKCRHCNKPVTRMIPANFWARRRGKIISLSLKTPSGMAGTSSI